MAQKIVTRSGMSAGETAMHWFLILFSCGLWYPVYRARRHQADRTSVTEVRLAVTTERTASPERAIAEERTMGIERAAIGERTATPERAVSVGRAGWPERARW